MVELVQTTNTLSLFIPADLSLIRNRLTPDCHIRMFIVLLHLQILLLSAGIQPNTNGKSTASPSAAKKENATS